MYDCWLPVLCCPTCMGTLTFEGAAEDGRLLKGSLKCLGCENLYLVDDEIPYLVDPKVSQFDWEWAVEIEANETFEAFDQAYFGSIPESARDARPHLLNRIVQLANHSRGPILDVATGRGVLLRELALLLTVDQPVLGIDIDRKVIRGTQRFLRRRGLYDAVSLAVMDARHLAIRSESLGTVTSWFGFNNIPEALIAIRETSRVLTRNGDFVVSSLCVEDDSNTFRVAEEAGFSDFLSSQKVRESMESAGVMIDRLETFADGTWPWNPYDAIPLPGDKFYHRLIIAHRP